MKRLIPWALLGLLVGCGDDASNGDPPGPQPSFVLPPDTQLEQSVTMHIEPGILSTGTSADGRLSIMAPTGSVDQPTDLTIAKLTASARPEGVVGDVYVIGPSSAALLKPLRLRLSHSGGATDGLRFVRLDTGVADYRVLDRWVYVAATQTFAGSTTSVGAFALSDGSGPTLANDRNPTTVAEANEALAQRAVAAAQSLYESAATADPNDLPAHFGAALTRIALLPEHQAVDDLLTLCGEPPVDVQGILLGDDGFLAHAIEDRQGASTLTLETGPTTSNLAAMELEPNEIQTRFIPDYWDPGAAVRIAVEDRESGDSGNRIRIELEIDPTATGWTDGGDIDVTDLPSNSSLDIWIGDDEGDIGPGWTYIEPTSGTIHVVEAGELDGDTVVVEFRDVVFEKFEDNGKTTTVVEAYKVNGTITDILLEEFDPGAGTVPFVDLEWDEGPPERSEPVQFFEACGATFTQTYMKARLTEIATELDIIQAHLDAIGNHPQADNFSWKLPVGTIANGIEIPVGIVEVHGARAFLHLGDAAHGLVDAYNIINPATGISSLFSNHNNYYETCSTICDPDCTTTCTTESYAVHDIDLGLLYAGLSGYFLEPTVGSSFGASDVAGVKASLEDALGAAIDALNANPTEEVLFNFRVDATAAAAADELIGFGNDLVASLTSDVTVTDTPEWVLHPHQYFTAPFTATSLLADEDVDELWEYTPPVEPTNCEPSCESAELVPSMDMVFTALESFVTLPSFPSETTYCTGDGQCTGESYWECNGYEEQGVCQDDMVTECWSWNDCSDGAVECIHDVCSPRDPQFFDYEMVGDAYEHPDYGPPRFINEALADEIGEGF